jgi:hypothetical protein
MLCFCLFFLVLSAAGGGDFLASCWRAVVMNLILLNTFALLLLVWY